MMAVRCTLRKTYPYNEVMLSAEFDRPINTIKLALETFRQFGMIDIVNDVMLVSNWV